MAEQRNRQLATPPSKSEDLKRRLILGNSLLRHPRPASLPVAGATHLLATSGAVVDVLFGPRMSLSAMSLQLTQLAAFNIDLLRDSLSGLG